MWVVKTKGETYYVNHVDCNVPWSTKETPDNANTKGSIKVKHCKLTIDSDNNASIFGLTEDEKNSILENKPPIRVITSNGKSLKNALENHNIKHGPIKCEGGGCSTLWYITQLSSEEDLTMLMLVVPSLRKLMLNEYYYSLYDEDDEDITTDPEVFWDD